METESDWRKMCLRKHKFKEKRYARYAIKRKQKEGVKLGMYLCPHCNSFHLFNKTKKSKNKRAKDRTKKLFH